MVEKFISLPFLDYQLFNNTVGNFADALVYFLGFLVVFKVLQFLILGKLSRLAGKDKEKL